MSAMRDVVLRFMNPAVLRMSQQEILTNAALGLAGEAGEFADCIKKVRFQGHALDDDMLEKLTVELGDVLFYVHLALIELGTDEQSITDAVETKLTTRYGSGFSVPKSINREESV